jgi:hypothetical protein
MILTLATVKLYTGMSTTDTAYDARIEALISPVLYDTFDYTKNYFHNNSVSLRSHQLTFSTGSSTSGGTITISGTNFSTYSFADGDEIHIQDSQRNDGFYTAASVSSATITISTTQTLKVESWEAPVKITKMQVPDSLLPIMSAMVKNRIDNPLGNPVSESLGDYSVTYGNSDYPAGIEKSLNKYRLVGFA